MEVILIKMIFRLTHTYVSDLDSGPVSQDLVLLHVMNRTAVVFEYSHAPRRRKSGRWIHDRCVLVLTLSGL